MRVVFWGTSDFALPTLEGLARSGHQVVAVVTQPDRPAGRGRRPRPTPVKEAAEGMGLPLLQPEAPRGEDFLEELASLEPDVSVVAAYGEILTEAVLEVPSLGSINVHASLLPELRGAAPVNWAIIRGHERSGVSVMRMVRELDAGPVLRQEAVELAPTTIAGELFETLSRLGADLLLETLPGLASGEVEEREQDHDRATYAPKLDREDARLDWALSAAEVDRWVRGCDPWPAAWSRLRGDPEGDGTRVQLFAPTRVLEAAGSAEPGRVVVADPKEGLVVAAGEGALEVGEVKPAGKTRMEAAAWVRGRGVAEGEVFA